MPADPVAACWAGLVAAAEPERAWLTGRAMILFIIVAGGLVLFLLGIVVLTLLYRRGREREASARRQREADEEMDAWRAAGERAEPYAIDESQAEPP